MNIDDLPSESLTCGRCGHAQPWNDYTLTALDRACGDGDSWLVCSSCRRAETERECPIRRQARAKRGSLRDAELRAVELQAALERAASAGIWSPQSVRPADLTRQLAETQRAITRHRDELAVLDAAIASGATERISINRRTAHCRRSAVPPSIESTYP